MKKIILLLVLSITNNLMAQKDTLYYKLDDVYNTNWISATKNNAEFYRPIPLKKEGGLYHIKDFYINGTLQMDGYTSNPEKDIFQGITIWYYKNGNKEKEFTYANGELNGLAKTYFKDGTLKAEGSFENDVALNGTFGECCPENYVVEKKDGKIIAEYLFYKDTKVIAEESFKDEKEQTNRVVAYNKKGEEIAEVTVAFFNKYLDGKRVWFDKDLLRNIINIRSIANYKNRELHGESIDYDANGNIIASGIYQNDYYDSGTFYSGGILFSYENGVLEGKEIAYLKDTILAQGFNKNGEPWEGQFKKGYNDIQTFKNGQLEGKQTTYYSGSYEDDFKNVKSYNTIKNNLKEGASAYFSKEGKELAKGIYKNNEPWQGTFYNEYYKTLTSFKEGVKHGLFIQYDFAGEILSQQEYKNGKIAGVIKSTGNFQNRECACEYEGGEPLDGEVCDDFSVLYYENAKIVKRETYARDKQEQLVAITVYDDQGVIIKDTNYYDNKPYVLKYKKGKPYDGEEFVEYNGKLTTYKKGIKNGPFYENNYYNGEFIEGNNKDGLWHGKITFTNSVTDRETSCTFIKGKPIDGTYPSKTCVTNFKGGLKEGVESCEESLRLTIKNEFTEIYDSISKTFKNDVLNGEVRYFKDGVLVNSGTYTKGSKYQGTFYVNKLFQNLYKEGKLIESSYCFGNYNHKDFYENWLISKEILYKDSEIVYQGEFKNGEAYNGTFITVDDKKHPRYYSISNVKEGVKQGLEKKILLAPEAEIEYSSTEYDTGNITKKTFRIPFKDKQKIEGYYKNGKPFSGQFYYPNSQLDSLIQLEKGVKKGYQYYAIPNSDLEELIDSINYSRGAPISGCKIEIKNKITHKHIYEEGLLIKTSLYNPSTSKSPGVEVVYTNKGFVINLLKQDNRSGNGLPTIIREKYNEVVFETKNHSDGLAIFYKDNKEIGNLTFGKGEIKTIDINLIINSVEQKVYIKEPKQIVIEVRSKEEMIVFHPEIELPKNINYNYFLNFIEYLSDSNGTVYYYLDQEEKPYASCTFKNGKRQNGTVVRINPDGTYFYEELRDGEEYNETTNLSKEELLKLLKKNKK